MSRVGFEPIISAGERALTHSLDGAATVTGLPLQPGKKTGNLSQCGPSDRMNLSLDFPLLKTERDCLRKKVFFSKPKSRNMHKIQ